MHSLYLRCADSMASDTPCTKYGSSAQVFGANEFKAVPTKAFLVLLFENLKDPTLLLLMAAAMVSHCWELSPQSADSSLMGQAAAPGMA